MDNSQEVINWLDDIRSGKRCCCNGKLVEFDSGHFCQRHTPFCVLEEFSEYNTIQVVEWIKNTNT